MLGMSRISTVGWLSYIIPELCPKILSSISRMSKILQKLSKIPENSQKIWFFDGDISRKNEL